MRVDEHAELDICHSLQLIDSALFYRMFLLGCPSSMHSSEFISKEFALEELPVQIYGKTLTLTLIL